MSVNSPGLTARMLRPARLHRGPTASVAPSRRAPDPRARTRQRLAALGLLVALLGAPAGLARAQGQSLPPSTAATRPSVAGAGLAARLGLSVDQRRQFTALSAQLRNRQLAVVKRHQKQPPGTPLSSADRAELSDAAAQHRAAVHALLTPPQLAALDDWIREHRGADSVRRVELARTARLQAAGSRAQPERRTP